MEYFMGLASNMAQIMNFKESFKMEWERKVSSKMIIFSTMENLRRILFMDKEK